MASEATARPLSRRWPAEWEPHAQTWMGWPERPDTWPQGAVPAREAFVAVAAAIAKFERVTVCATAAGFASAASALAPLYPRVRVVEMSQDDSWFRDTGPIFVEEDGRGGGAAAGAAAAPTTPEGRATQELESSRRVVGLCFTFDAWGRYCYPDWSRDALVGQKICALERVPWTRRELVLEGGAVHSDGEGTLLTTTECLLEPNAAGRCRNPGVPREDVERELCEQLGVMRILWVPRGVAGDDDTNGHVDNMCCFLRPGVVALHWADADEDLEQHARSAEAEAYLQSSRDAAGRAIEVVRVLAPRGLERTAAECPADGEGRRVGLGEPMPGSYINFYVAGDGSGGSGGGVVVPTFGDEERDAAAVAVLSAHFPDREVAPVPHGRSILAGGGNIHCITKQQPRG